MEELTYPKGIYLELTNRCNLTCPMCRISAIKGQILDINIYKEIAQTLFPHGTFVDLRGWGESTILKDFESYLQVASDYTIQKKIITNGTSGKEKTWQLLAEHNVMTGFSIDAISPELFKKLRGGADINVVFDNVRFLMNELDQRGATVVDQVYFVMVMGSENLIELSELVSEGAQMGIKRFKIEPITLDSEEDPEHLINHRDEVLKCIDKLSLLSVKYDLDIELNAAPIPELARLNITKKLCLHPFDYVYINAAGRIGFCDHLNGLDHYTYGHWEQGFHEVWNGEQMKKLRAQHEEKMASDSHISMCEECNWCYKNRFADLEEMVSPSWQDYLVKL